MLTNTDCTIYSRKYNPSKDYDEWERQYVPICWWFHDTKSNVATNGLECADVLTVRISDMSVKVKKGDVIVQGDCPVEMQMVKDLKGYDHFDVTTANYNHFGSNPHIKVVAV